MATFKQLQQQNDLLKQKIKELAERLDHKHVDNAARHKLSKELVEFLDALPLLVIDKPKPTQAHSGIDIADSRGEILPEEAIIALQAFQPTAAQLNEALHTGFQVDGTERFGGSLIERATPTMQYLSDLAERFEDTPAGERLTTLVEQAQDGS